jgi:hypothetical protein
MCSKFCKISIQGAIAFAMEFLEIGNKYLQIKMSFWILNLPYWKTLNMLKIEEYWKHKFIFWNSNDMLFQYGVFLECDL